MRNLISVVALVAGVFVAAPVVAAEQNVGAENTHATHQFLSKRPYVAPVVAKAESDQAWIGATLVVDGNQAGANVHQPQRLHNLGRRAY